MRQLPPIMAYTVQLKAQGANLLLANAFVFGIERKFVSLPREQTKQDPTTAHCSLFDLSPRMVDNVTLD